MKDSSVLDGRSISFILCIVIEDKSLEKNYQYHSKFQDQCVANLRLLAYIQFYNYSFIVRIYLNGLMHFYLGPIMVFF